MGVAVAFDELELWLCVGGGVGPGVVGGEGEGTTATLVGAAVLGAVVVG